MMNRLKTIVAGFLVMLSCGLNHADLQAQSKDNTVRLCVSLTNHDGEVVATVPPDQIAVYEDGAPQKIISATHEEGPVSVGILVDVSTSQRKHFPAVIDAVRVFLENSAREDEFFVVNFGENIRLLSDFADQKATLDKLIAPAFEKRSKVYEAIHFGLEKLHHGKYARHALLVITDGQEDGSQISYGNLLRAIKENEAQIFCLGVGNTNSDESSGPGNYWLGHLFLEEIAAITGGTAYMKDKPEQLMKEAKLIAQQLWYQYRIEYQPSATGDEKKWHKIKAQIHPPGSKPQIIVRARQGYFMR